MDDSTQAAQAGDAQTSQEEGQSFSIDIMETEETKETEEVSKETTKETEESEGTANNEDSQKWRISQKQWQDMKELAKEAKGLKDFQAKMASLLGVEEEEIKDSDNIMGKLQSQVETLKLESSRKDWEADHPVVRSEKNRDAWQKAVKDKGDLVKQGLLTWDEVWKITKPDSPVSKTPSEHKEQELAIGSVPFSSKETAKGGLDSDVESLLLQAGIPKRFIE